MYPKNIELYNATLSEKIVYKALMDQLPDTYTVFYSVQWVDKQSGTRQQSECDFLIFNEQEGFLTCEVKGGKGYKKVNDCFVLIESDGERVLRRSPMAQSEESSRYFFDLYSKEYNDRFNGTYGSISLFPFYNVDDPVLLDHRTKDVVLDHSDMGNLLKRIKKAFSFYRSSTHTYGSLTKAQRDNFKNLINKQIAVQAAAGAIIETKELELANLNRIQDNFVFFLKNHSQTFITGGAGTGKTWIAFKFAKQAGLQGKQVLLTTLNKQLTKMFSQMLKGYSNIQVKSFEELVASDGIPCSVNTSSVLQEYQRIRPVLFDTIVVDEAQDFDRNQAVIITKHLRDPIHSELRVFYDSTQNIMNKDFQDGFSIGLSPFVLRENLRNTSSIYEWATDRTSLGRDVITNQIIGPIPVSYSFSKDYDARQYIEAEINHLVLEDGVPLSSVVVLTDHECYQKLIDNSIGCWNYTSDIESNDAIRLFLVEDFKGLESNVVFYYHEITTPENYNYVAFTRAKYYLFDVVLK